MPTGCGVWRIASKERMVWTTPSSLTSKSAWVRSVTGLPSAVTKTSVRTKLASVRNVGLGRRRRLLLSTDPPARPSTRQDADTCGNHE